MTIEQFLKKSENIIGETISIGAALLMLSVIWMGIGDVMGIALLFNISMAVFLTLAGIGLISAIVFPILSLIKKSRAK